MSEKASGMSSVQEAIGVLAGPFEGNRKGWLGKVKVKGVSYRTVKAIWYREIKDEGHLAAQAIKRTAELIKAKQEVRDHAANIRISIERLRHNDPDFFSGEIDRLERALDRLRGLDSA